MLFVCTGNTCRSPLAEVYLKKLRPAWEVGSAGVQAEEGRPASRLAREVAEAEDLDLSHHRSRSLEVCTGPYDGIWVMSPRHLSALPSKEAELLSTLAGESRSIRDPYGGDLVDYQRAFGDIKRCVDALARLEV